MRWVPRPGAVAVLALRTGQASQVSSERPSVRPPAAWGLHGGSSCVATEPRG